MARLDQHRNFTEQRPDGYWLCRLAESWARNSHGFSRHDDDGCVGLVVLSNEEVTGLVDDTIGPAGDFRDLQRFETLEDLELQHRLHERINRHICKSHPSANGWK